MNPSSAPWLGPPASDNARRTWYLVRVHSRLGWLASWLTHATRVDPVATAPPSGWQLSQAGSYGVGDGLLGQPLACGGTLTDSVMAVANLSLLCGTRVRLRYDGRMVEAQVLDRSPYVTGMMAAIASSTWRSTGSR